MMNGIYGISQTPTFVSSYFFLSPLPVEEDVNSVDVASLFSYAWWERRKRRRG
jgi:hypothetical protein